MKVVQRKVGRLSELGRVDSLIQSLLNQVLGLEQPLLVFSRCGPPTRHSTASSLSLLATA